MEAKIKKRAGIFDKYDTKKDKVFVVGIYVILTWVGIVTLYPILYIISSSLSSADAVISGEVFIFPVDFTIEAYEAVFAYDDVWTGYLNSTFYTLIGSACNMVLVLILAYPLSRHYLYGRKQITFFLTFTMMFSAGLIPTYILMNDLSLINTRFVVILLNLLPIGNVILARTFYKQNISDDIVEAAQIDGANEIQIIISIVAPLSKSILAVIALFSIVDYWNDFFIGLIYLTDQSKYPLQVFLRDILILGSIDPDIIPMDQETLDEIVGINELLKYAIIIVSTVPIMCIYPFIQKFFVKGIMEGSIKG